MLDRVRDEIRYKEERLFVEFVEGNEVAMQLLFNMERVEYMNDATIKSWNSLNKVKITTKEKMFIELCKMFQAWLRTEKGIDPDKLKPF